MNETPGYSAQKQQVLMRLKRIEGQVRGLQRLIDEDTYCIDVLTQISAATKALHSVGLGLVEEHVNHCVLHAAEAGDEATTRAHVAEATRAIERLMKS